MPTIEQQINSILLNNGVRGITNSVITDQLKSLIPQGSTPHQKPAQLSVSHISTEDMEKGVRCTTCDQHVKIYRRRLYFWMSFGLIRLYKKNVQDPTGFFHLTDDLLLNKIQQADFSKMRYWGLIEEADDPKKQTNGRTSGYWRITNKGRQFVELKIKVPAYARVYNQTFLGHEGEKNDIKQTLGVNFSYTELMSK